MSVVYIMNLVFEFPFYPTKPVINININVIYNDHNL